MLETLFGSSKDLNALQMADRAFVLFWITLFLIRLGGMRAFGRKSSFDSVIVIMLGAVLSRAVAGASAFLPTIAAAIVLVVVHRLVAMAVARWRWFERLIKGHHQVVRRSGKIQWSVMKRSGISEADLAEATRSQLHVESVSAAGDIVLESDGVLTVLEQRASADCG